MNEGSGDDLSRTRKAGHETFAFLNHSPTTLPNNLPPSVDDKPLARQRRKRTCPLDQAILEEAFRNDPKPDKSARLKIVAKVSLGEKEVQIWFQNRRQSSRRRSRPLLAHEIAHYQSTRAAALDNELEHEADDSASLRPSDLLPAKNGDEMIDRSDMSSDSSPGFESHTARRAVARSSASLEWPTSVPHVSSRDLEDGIIGPDDQPQSPMFQTLLPAEAAEMIDTTNSSDKKAPTCVRLSMSACGKAEVVTKDVSAPSPPRPHQTLVGAQKIAPIPQAPRFRKSISGRSRDSRSWEFWCDKESRAEFEHTAEKDASGSAAGAIGLLRSASGRSVLASIPHKRNIVNPTHIASAKRARLDQRRHKLHRSQTTLGRLQNESAHVETHNAGALPKLKYSVSASNTHFTGDKEGNKENISPESGWSARRTSTSRSQQRPATTERLGQQLDDIASAGKKRRLSLPHVSTKDREGEDPDADLELATFMRGSSRSTSASEGDDLDCIQGLLSLSQGNWK